jgi:hypothetical protein
VVIVVIVVIGNNPYDAASTLSSILASEIAPQTGANLQLVYDWYMGLGVWADIDLYGISGQLPARLESLQGFPTGGPPVPIP